MTVRFRFTGRGEGDLGGALDAGEQALRRASVLDAPWSWLEQVHGATVVTVTAPGGAAGARGDALVTDVAGAVLAVRTADCAPVLLRSGSGGPTVVAAAHAGWRGLCEGVLEATVDAMRSLGAEDVSWRLGPCISPAAYEFGVEDLDVVASRFGPQVRSETAAGAPALDLRAGVRAALDQVGALEAASATPIPCTVVDPGWYSWRRDRTGARQASLVWIEPGDAALDPAAPRWA